MPGQSSQSMLDDISPYVVLKLLHCFHMCGGSSIFDEIDELMSVFLCIIYR